MDSNGQATEATILSERLPTGTAATDRRRRIYIISTLHFAAPITVKERVNLDNIRIEWAAGAAPGRSKSWNTLFVSKTGFDGELASLDSRYYTRVANTDNGYEYQIRPKIGAVVTFR